MSFQTPGLTKFTGLASSPAAVYWGGSLWVFYTTTANSTSIWYAESIDGGNKWNAAQQVPAEGLSIAPGTSPCPVVFDGKLYLFFNGSGNDGTFVTIFYDPEWSLVSAVATLTGVPMGFLPGTSPAAAVYRGEVHLFWNGAGDNGVFCLTTNGSTWGAPFSCADRVPGLSIAPGTSPCAVGAGDALYLFWNGRGGTGTWYATHTYAAGDGLARVDEAWSVPASVKAQVAGMDFFAGTSPAAQPLDAKDAATLRLFWVGPGGPSEGVAHSVMGAGGTWSAKKLVAAEVGGQALAAGTSPCAINFTAGLFLFWSGADQVLRFAELPNGSWADTIKAFPRRNFVRKPANRA
ncbi:hypothetical protein B0T24DRAFT_664858 [Lasiosphaeria ovina]|uniref:Uncharacterized protein n=1 Tax=Lasiosphaeria ovina TaxID=92902 RepID=A0AAE0KFF9_9PEZI|nr:hypothetical protein B0T24DRAFT_664858 [Lasiosphaeria ovina]